MKRKFMSLSAFLLTAATLLSACSGGGSTTTTTTEAGNQGTEAGTEVATEAATEAPSGEIEVMRMFYPGDESDRMSEFLDNEFAERMAADLNLKVELQYSPWDQYWAQKDIVLAAQEPIDLYWDGLPNLSQIINEKQAQPLDDLIAEYAPNLTNVIPESHLDGGKVDGIQYGIPSSYAASSGMYQFVTARKDLLEAVGMETLATPDDLREYAQKVKEQFPDLLGPADTIFKPLTRFYQDEPLTFAAKEELVVFGEESGQVMSYYETEAFQEVAKFNESMFADGLYQDELATNYNERTSRIQNGLYIWGEGSVGKDLEIQDAVRQNAPDAVMANYILAPEEPRLITSTGGEVLAIPHTAPNPSGAMRFINWLYESEENYLFAIYGVEGKDYTLEGDRINRTSLNDFFYEWMFRNLNYQKFGTDISDEYIEEYTHWDDNAEVSKLIGFVFDNTEVVNIEAAILEAAGQNMAPIRDGFMSFDEHYESAVQALKYAGIDEYIAEVQRQVDEFLANKE